jgi:hypothetical protein
MIRMIRSSVLALVLAGLVAPAAFAGRPAPVPASDFAAVWEWVVSAFAPVTPVSKAPGRGIMEKAGSHMDPDGTPHFGVSLAGPTTSEGASVAQDDHN